MKILDENNNVVKEATVTGDFYLDNDGDGKFETTISENVSGTANGQGEAKLDSGKFDASTGDDVKFKVTDVDHPDFTYEPDNNNETSETTTI
ncbi:hypothetical protein AKJ51_04250 [candidate division MSBL1 archaeon SCGC-AAA382A20]|uniref:Uncharacterized protein n=1 Tax=candidate division MSBL1 archaeon SCGC-AAA382A20 TaxID=1698280 RepID=A0A133VHZ9_9EURY|nr:hypothetical protein AKJ51_04250 [candidate division MSBL1 archaeon SCGC-AAA382A20]